MNIFDKQIYHFLALVLLLPGVCAFLDEGARSGRMLGLPTHIWFWLSVALPILHQIYVWFCWRIQLKYGLITRSFGDHGFTVYAVGFSVLIVSRPVLIILLSVSNRNSIVLSPAFAYVLALIFIILSGYVLYSVYTYFGFKRAYGIDHFDESYRQRPFVREGIFRFTANAMYTFGFLILWVPGLICFSKAALIAAGFSHMYIWVHYYTTELPDIRVIYDHPTSGTYPDMDDIRQFKEWQRFVEGADVVDVKTIESRNDLRTFVAASFSYHPWWMVMLYRIRTLIVCVLGLVKHEAPEQLPDLKPAQIPFAPGEKATFFTVRLAKEGHYWIAETPPDKHLKAYVGILAEPLTNGLKRYYIVTIVHYLHWTGPVYFNLIRPFHHLVVARMARAGAGVSN